MMERARPALSRAGRIGRRGVRIFGWVLAALALAVLWLWSSFAIYYSNLPLPLRVGLAVVFAIAVPVALIKRADRAGTIRYFLIAVCVVMLWWLRIPASHERDWAPDQAILPYAEIDGDHITLRNVRCCSYVTTDDYTVRHEDRGFKLSELESVWFVVEPFSAWQGAAHTLLSFGFAGDRYLAVSVETRREKGEGFSAWQGLFKQYELIYVVGDERDLIHLRANIRGDNVYLFPVRASREEGRALFLDVLSRINEIRARPEFYHSVTNTCTTNIVAHVNRIAPRKIPFHGRVLFPGYSDRLAYDLGLIDTELSFDEAKRRFQINDAATRFQHDPDFSIRIRRRKESGATFDRRADITSSMTESERRVVKLLARLEAWLRMHRPQYLAGLNPPASAAELQDLEVALAAPLGAELRALLTWRNGQGPGLIGGFEQDWILLSSERIAAAKRLLDVDAASSGWHRDWVPFLDNDAGDYLCFDAGASVRAFRLGKQEHPVVAASLADWLGEFVTNVENGNYVEEPERGTFLRRG